MSSWPCIPDCMLQTLDSIKVHTCSSPSLQVCVVWRHRCVKCIDTALPCRTKECCRTGRGGQRQQHGGICWTLDSGTQGIWNKRSKTLVFNNDKQYSHSLNILLVTQCYSCGGTLIMPWFNGITKAYVHSNPCGYSLNVMSSLTWYTSLLSIESTVTTNVLKKCMK